MMWHNRTESLKAKGSVYLTRSCASLLSVCFETQWNLVVLRFVEERVAAVLRRNDGPHEGDEARTALRRGYRRIQ